MAWPHLEIVWQNEDNYAGDSEKSKNDRKTDIDRRRDGKITSTNGQEWSLEIS